MSRAGGRSFASAAWKKQFGGLPEPDVVDLLLEQHTILRDTMADLLGAAPAERAALWEQCVDLLVRHEEGEQAMVHPNAADDDPPGQPATQDRLEEEREATALLESMEGLDPATPAFEEAFIGFREAVLTHAVREQRYEFNRLRQVFTPRSLVLLREDMVAFQAA